MLRSFRLLLCFCARLFRSRHDLLLENLALRQQLLTLKRNNPTPRLSHFGRQFWVTARRLWSNWKKALVIVTPETVVSWHRAGFRLYWRWRSRHQKAVGRKPLASGGITGTVVDETGAVIEGARITILKVRTLALPFHKEAELHDGTSPRHSFSHDFNLPLTFTAACTL